MTLPKDFMAKFDREKNPISEEQFVELLKDREYKFVLHTRLNGEHDGYVITIWDGYDPYRMDEELPHLIFETTVFRPTTDPKGIKLDRDSEQRWKTDDKFESVRHETEERARAYNIAIAERILGRSL